MLPKIIFSRHAIYQIKDRNIDETEIFEAITNPDQVNRYSDGKLRSVKEVKRNNKVFLLIVIHKPANLSVKIITAFLTSKINKYLIK